MKFRPRAPSNSVIYVIVALAGAVTLVLYLHHRAVATFDRQSELIFYKISEVTGQRLIREIRATLEGPVLDTLWSIGGSYGKLRTLLQAGRVDLLEQQYAEGLEKYPQVERFFLWTAGSDGVAPTGDVLFYGGPAQHGSSNVHVTIPVHKAPERNARTSIDNMNLDNFYRDPALGRVVADVAQQHMESRPIYVAAEGRVGTTTYAIFIRRLWSNAQYDPYFALCGFVVNLDTVRATLFQNLYRMRLGAILQPGEGSPLLAMRVLDDTGHQVFGPSRPLSTTAVSMPFALRFYPEHARTRMASTMPVPIWTLNVSAAPGSSLAQLDSMLVVMYWLSGTSVLLMLAALLFAVKGSRRASELSRVQSDFVAHVSHQLMTPLSLLSAVSETLSLGRVHSALKLDDYIGIVRAETANLSGLVQRILEFSRHEAQRRPYEFEPVNLTALVRESVDGFLQALADADVAIAVVGNDSEKSPLVVHADPAALEQVLLNLLDNAVRYSGTRRDITVRVGRLGSEAFIEVEDKGIGISAADVGRIFERFYRGAGAPLNRHGFGLGLAIARQIVRAHHGTIEVKSALGHGSIFRVRLPSSRKMRAGLPNQLSAFLRLARGRKS